jgi:hypothetical protein
LNTLEEIELSYSSLLSNKQYEKIPINITKTLGLLSILKLIYVSDPKISLLLTIVQDTLIGTIDIISFHKQLINNEVIILLLNKEIDDILMKKNC